MFASYWLPCIATSTLFQPPTIASTQQNGNHSSTFLMTLPPLLSTITFISLLALVSLNSNILRFHPNPNFPVTSLSNVMFGSGSEIQTVKRDDCPIHQKRLYFGQKSLFFHFSNPYLWIDQLRWQSPRQLMPLQLKTKWVLVVGSSWKQTFFGSVIFGTDRNYNLSSTHQKASNAIFLRGRHSPNFASSSSSTRSVLPDQESSASNPDQTTLEQKLTLTMVSPIRKSSPTLSNWSPSNRSNATFFSTSITSQVRRTPTPMILVEAEPPISAKIHES